MSYLLLMPPDPCPTLNSPPPKPHPSSLTFSNNSSLSTSIWGYFLAKSYLCSLCKSIRSKLKRTQPHCAFSKILLDQKPFLSTPNLVHLSPNIVLLPSSSAKQRQLPCNQPQTPYLASPKMGHLLLRYHLPYLQLFGTMLSYNSFIITWKALFTPPPPPPPPSAS